MSLTIFLSIELEGNPVRVLVADDSEDVIAAFEAPINGSKSRRVDSTGFVEEIKAATPAMPIIAILDGSICFWNSRGSLEAWLKSIEVVGNTDLLLIGYSGDEADKTAQCIRWYVKTSSVIEDVRELMMMCSRIGVRTLEAKDLPHTLTSPASRLSRAIHGIENLAVPVRIDIGTLREDPAALDEICGENLSHDGYLGERRAFSNCGGIECEIARYLDSLAALKLDTLRAVLKPYLANGTVAPTLVRDRLKIKSARDAARSMEGGSKSVSEVIKQLEGFADAIRELSRKLRQVRDAEESRQEEGQ